MCYFRGTFVMRLSSEAEHYLLKSQIQERGQVQIIVSGYSMMPTIEDGTKIIVSEKKIYELGDILVFSNIVSKRLNVHRLVMKCNGFYYCKGDNSFAIEKITVNNIIGAVLFQNINGIFTEPKKQTKQFIYHSLRVGLEFCKMGFDKEKILDSKIYVDYKTKYLLE